MKLTVKAVLVFFSFYYGISTLCWIPSSCPWKEFVTLGPIVLIVGLLSFGAVMATIAEDVDKMDKA
jgi:hypothetical protein